MRCAGLGRHICRGAPRGLPFQWDQGDHSAWSELHFDDQGRRTIDLLGEITGGGSYADLQSHTVRLDMFRLPNASCLNLERLIHVKRAAGRPKDFEAIAELEAILEERPRRGAIRNRS